MRVWLVGGLAALTLSWPASAHRGHDALSVVEIEPQTGRLLVTHRAAAHDVEPALSEIAPDAQQSLDDPAAREALEAYGARAFRIWDAGGAPVALTHVSTDLAGDRVTLVYAGRLAPPAKSLVVDSDLFEAQHPDQENQVNVRRGKVTKSARFVLGTGPVRIRFD